MYKTGTIGTLTWTIDGSVLTVKPTEGETGEYWKPTELATPWVYLYEYIGLETDDRAEITSIVFEGDCILGMSTVIYGEIRSKSFYYFFTGFKNLTEVDVSGLNTTGASTFDYMFAIKTLTKITGFEKLDFSSAKDCTFMFRSSMLTSIDLSTFDFKTDKTLDFCYMFDDMQYLERVILPENFDRTRAVYFDSAYQQYYFGLASTSAPASNSSGVIVESDEDFFKLTNKGGVWTRDLSKTKTFTFHVVKSTRNAAIVTLTCTYGSASAFTVNVYQKKNSESSYGTEAVYTTQLTGSGTEVITLVMETDDGYDFKITASNGDKTVVTFPSVDSNILLMELDEDGNLNVGGDIYAGCGSEGGDGFKVATFDAVYPVGAIYMSVNDTNPSILFGGTWEQIKDKFLLSAGDSYAAGSTGGEATHKLTVSEMPSHTHVQNQHRHSMGSIWSDGTGSDSRYVMESKRGTQTRYTAYSTPTNQNTGGGGAHNNMPPYLTVYMWQRTA